MLSEEDGGVWGICGGNGEAGLSGWSCVAECECLNVAE